MTFLNRPSALAMLLATAVGLSTAPAFADEAASRWVAALPFGAGQFQNGDVALGVFFAAGEALLGGTSIATVVLVDHLASTSAVTRGGQPVDFSVLNTEMNRTTMVNRMAFAGWAALTVAGAIEAEVQFGPRRAAPPDERSPSVAATAAPVPGGGVLGFRATF